MIPGAIYKSRRFEPVRIEIVEVTELHVRFRSAQIYRIAKRDFDDSYEAVEAAQPAGASDG